MAACEVAALWSFNLGSCLPVHESKKNVAVVLGLKSLMLKMLYALYLNHFSCSILYRDLHKQKDD